MILLGWLPMLAVLVLVGFAIGWWAAVLGVLPFVFFAVLGVRRYRQLRDRPPANPAAVRAELLEIESRSTPWIKAWASCSIVFAVLGVALLLVTAFQMR